MRNGSRLASSAVAGGILACCALLLPVVAASAQQQGGVPGGPGIPNVENVWDLQAKWVAQDLALTPELTAKLVDAYTAARQSQLKAMQAQFNQQGGGNRDMAGFRKINDTERATFEAALKGFLNPEQTAKALATLGGYNRRWDRLVSTLDGMKLEAATMAKAMSIVATYAAEYDNARRTAMDSGTLDTARDTMKKLNDKLDSDMAGVLPADQMTQWKQATSRGGARGGEAPRPQAVPAPAPEK